MLIDQDGREAGRVVGWDAAGLRTLLSVPVTDEPPLRKPGCAAKNTYDPEELRLLDGAGYDELEEMFERGLDGRAPCDPADAGSRGGDAGRPRPVGAAR